MSGDLPSSWAVVQLDQLLAPLSDGRTLHHGWSPQCEKEPARTDDEWGVLKTTAIQAGAFLPEHNKRLPESLSPRPQHEVKEGDLLITCAGPRVRCGVPCYVQRTRPRLMLSGKMYRFRTREDICDPRYLEKYLLSHAAQTAIDGMKTGGNDSGLNLTHDRFKPLPVSLAPLREQQRIVSRIEELFSDIAEGERALERVGQLVERYRQSVLKAAVTGELTRAWRERRGIDTSAESAAELPTGWQAAPLSELGEFGRGKSKHRPRNDPKLFGGTYPFLQTGAVRASRGRITEYDSTYSEFGLAQSKLWPAGTVCITIAANIAASGVLAFDACFPDSVVGLVPAPEVSGEYVEYFIRTARESLDRYAPATAQKNINLDILEKVSVPLPPPDEQAVVCSRVREVLSVIDALELTLEERRRQAEALRQSILKAAFSGQLVPQDPNDEPASALLARLAAEAASKPAEPKRRGRKPRQATTA